MPKRARLPAKPQAKSQPRPLFGRVVNKLPIILLNTTTVSYDSTLLLVPLSIFSYMDLNLTMPSADPQNQSPSPPPAPPIALTPGPRAAAFTTLYNSALSNTLKSVPYESFAACFPSIAEQAPAALKAMHSGLTSRLEQFAKDEFQTIMEERAVVERLNSLEDVIAEAKRRKARAADGEDIPVP